MAELVYPRELATRTEPRQLAFHCSLGFGRIGDPGTPRNAFVIQRLRPNRPESEAVDVPE